MNEILQIDNETEIVTSESNTSVCVTVEVYMYIGLIFQFEKKELFIHNHTGNIFCFECKYIMENGHYFMSFGTQLRGKFSF